jgi:hypothetical protein
VIRIQAEKKCSFLQWLADITTPGGSLESSMKAAALAVFSPSFQKGRIVVSQSGSGQSGSFQVGDGSDGWSQDNIAALCWALRYMLRAAVGTKSVDTGDVYVDDGDPGHTESLRQLLEYNILQGNMPEGVRSTLGDFTLINIPAMGTGVAN